MPQSNAAVPDWEAVLSSAARLQEILPGAVLVGGTDSWNATAAASLAETLPGAVLLGGTAAALHAGHRFSRDADHVLTDLRSRFDEVLARLESAAGRSTARVARPVQVLGSLDGIEIGVRQLIRREPLETTTLHHRGAALTLPAEAEILRIKGVLILRRNATRDYVDFAALATRMGVESAAAALRPFDRLYPQDNGESPLQQLQVQLASALPYDLEDADLSEYRNLAPRWHDWSDVKAACARVSVGIFDRVCGAALGR